ncbi:N-acetylmuramoyl-L-alanine amidase [Priestia filamentosa]|uniref:N-acetylmuramoyl-L-alanine amidase n=1 Tax=Priestia filamentosa TaxID=1402861 RepID=A0A0H4KY62_9BACI|nr:N-acetylmuramoyl-L-alanine amidase [Priestia filamentosa]AKO93243.1 N-acetylmuramoyl-L-alanine amidase [Priestia filamentosa]MDT3763390.1 N-acetylmuramoyl-L-alanine amidase [Priestia filamentosa]OXS69945.1 N-acetylmuramoyl-L-alanine amidase [Priestia filamentosa]WRU97614.1 N-acetylmuramoyl-L-alanine amidase [Priestia filamentosa]
MVKIFIDPGHGGTDSGAVSNGLLEKNLTWQIASAVRNMLINEYEDVYVLMSRTGDQTVSLTARTNAANAWNADYYLSIHINAGGGTGYEDYVFPGIGAPTTTYQNLIHEEILKSVDFTNRGKKTANFHVLRETNMPAILTENGFIDNVNDVAKLRNASFITSIARGHVNGLARAFNLQRKQQASLFKVQIGAFSSRENAERLASEAKTKGFSSFIATENNLFKVQIGAFSSRENAEALSIRAKNAGFEVTIIQ